MNFRDESGKRYASRELIESLWNAIQQTAKRQRPLRATLGKHGDDRKQ